MFIYPRRRAALSGPAAAEEGKKGNRSEIFGSALLNGLFKAFLVYGVAAEDSGECGLIFPEIVRSWRGSCLLR